jgi:hypothetical protein
MPRYRCLNCPGRPTFLSIEALERHWETTHTVPMEHTVGEIAPIHPLVASLLGDKVNQTIKLYEEVA